MGKFFVVFFFFLSFLLQINNTSVSFSPSPHSPFFMYTRFQISQKPKSPFLDVCSILSILSISSNFWHAFAVSAGVQNKKKSTIRVKKKIKTHEAFERKV